MMLQFRDWDSAISFWSGFVSAGSVTGLFLNIHAIDLIIEVPIKLFMAVAIAFMGGIAGLCAKDFYNHKIKCKFFPNLKNKKEEA